MMMYPPGSHVPGPPQEKKPAVSEWLRSGFNTISSWFREVELGVAWGIAGLSLIAFIFTSIWYIDPALLTMVMQFQPATCTTIYSSYLVGTSKCTWTSCRIGCTAEIFKCWHVVVNYTLLSGSRPIPPPWSSLSAMSSPERFMSSSGGSYGRLMASSAAQYQLADGSMTAAGSTKLYPNVRGCGYPPKLHCEDFFSSYGNVDSSYPCWISHVNPEMALTELDLKRPLSHIKGRCAENGLPISSLISKVVQQITQLLQTLFSATPVKVKSDIRLKEEVMYSLVPLATFIISTLYALCRLGVFSICNPLRCCPKSDESTEQIRLTPKQLFRYKRALIAKRGCNLEQSDDPNLDMEQDNLDLEEPREERLLEEILEDDEHESPVLDPLQSPLLDQERCFNYGIK